jgi:hypothetical protein
VKLILVIDRALLLAFNWTVIFCIEWFSWNRRWIERGCIIGYVTFNVVLSVDNKFEHHSSMMLYTLPFTLLIASAMWVIEGDSDTKRMARIWSMEYIAARVGWSGICAVFVFALLVVAVGEHGRYLVSAAAMACQLTSYVTYLYLMALPRGGEKGKRRKVALAKLKEWFGSLTWLPTPAMEPQ